MFGVQSLTTIAVLLGVATNIAYAGQLVDRQHVDSEALDVNTWVWTGVHEINGGVTPTKDEIYSLAIVALDEAYDDYTEAKKAGANTRIITPTEMTVTLTPDQRLYFSTRLESPIVNTPFVQRAQYSTNPAAKVVTSMLHHCSKRWAPKSITHIHDWRGACGEIATMYMYAIDHADPRTIRGSMDVSIRHNGGTYSTRLPCSLTVKGLKYRCDDVTAAADLDHINVATRVSTNDIQSHMSKLPNPRLQGILDDVPRRGCRRGEDGPSCNVTMSVV